MQNKFEETIVIDSYDTKENLIKYSKKFVYIPEITSRVPDEDNEDKYKVENVDWGRLYLDITKKNLDISTIKTLCFYNKCTVPRFKLKDFCIKNSITSIRDISKADAIILGPESIGEVIRTSYKLIIEPDKLYNIYNQYASHLRVKFSNFDQLLLDLKLCTCKYVFNHDDWDLRNFCTKQGLNNLSDHLLGSIETRISITDNIDFASRLLSPDNNFYGQDSILKLLNTGSVIDSEVYEQLKTMIVSEDKQNTVVAMEIMANCHYEKSIVYLCLLFREFYNSDIISRKENNNVNFKSLKKYICLGWKIRQLTLDDIINICINKDQLTRANVDILLEIAYREHKDAADTMHFRVTKVELPPDILAQVKEPISEAEEIFGKGVLYE